MITLKYRPEIDGLRAFAVLAVIGFHYFPAIIGGGFVGVDVFFVISGYLISSIIYKNLDLHCFNFLIFYQHRIRRIYPALILVIGCSLMAGSFLLFPDELAYLGKHILGGTLFISNIVLWNESGYFDKITQTKILMHLWSLGVEEQFYLLWPIILTFIWKTEKKIGSNSAFMLHLFRILHPKDLHLSSNRLFFSTFTILGAGRWRNNCLPRTL